MSTTTLRIDDALKARLAAAAERAGKTPHAFMLEALAEAVAQAEQDADFHAAADARWARLLATNETVPWDEARAWLQARLAGDDAPPPPVQPPGR